MALPMVPKLKLSKPGTRAARKGFGSGRPPHVADVTIYRDGHIAYAGTLSSGGMTAKEAALGFPRSTLATHTEARASRLPLVAGDTMIIEGQYSPCPTCRGVMNKASQTSGAEIHYLWEDKMWSAGGK